MCTSALVSLSHSQYKQFKSSLNFKFESSDRLLEMKNTEACHICRVMFLFFLIEETFIAAVNGDSACFE